MDPTLQTYNPWLLLYSTLLPPCPVRPTTNPTGHKKTDNNDSEPATAILSISTGHGESSHVFYQVLLGILFLTFARVIWWYFIFVPSGWKDHEEVIGALSSMVAATHSVFLIPPLYALLKSHPTKRPSSPFTHSSPTWNYLTRSMISLTTSYMIQDGLCIIYFSVTPNNELLISPENKLFLLHHFATLTYMTSCRFIRSGQYSTLLLMFFGEVTNPFQNSYAVLEIAERFQPSENTSLLKVCMGKLFASTYIFVRCFLGPLVGLYIVYDILLTKSGRGSVGLGYAILWSVAIIGVMGASVPFALNDAAVAW